METTNNEYCTIQEASLAACLKDLTTRVPKAGADAAPQLLLERMKERWQEEEDNFDDEPRDARQANRIKDDMQRKIKRLLKHVCEGKGKPPAGWEPVAEILLSAELAQLDEATVSGEQAPMSVEQGGWAAVSTADAALRGPESEPATALRPDQPPARAAEGYRASLISGAGSSGAAGSVAPPPPGTALMEVDDPTDGAIQVPVLNDKGDTVDAGVAMKYASIPDDGPIASTDPNAANYHPSYDPAKHVLLATHMDSSFKKIHTPEERLLLKTVVTQLLMHPEGTEFKVDGEHCAPPTLEEPALDATEQPRATGLSVVSKMDMTLPVTADDQPVKYQQWLLYALMQFGKTNATQIGNYVLHAIKAIIPAILLENRNSNESQRKFILEMRKVVRNSRACASWILARDKKKSWVQGKRCFGNISESDFLEKLDLKLRAKTLKLEDLTGCTDPMSVDEARQHLGLLEVEVVPQQTIDGQTKYVRRIKGGENQGVVMLCNRTNVEQLLGVTQSGAMKYEGLISLLIGQDKKVKVGAVNGRGGTELAAESAYTPYAGRSSRLLITIDEAGTLFGSKDKLGAEHKKSSALVISDKVGEKLMDVQQDVAELRGGTELRSFNKLAAQRELFKEHLNEDDDDDDEGSEDDERTLRRRVRASGAARARDDDEVSTTPSSVGSGDDDEDEDEDSVVIDEEELREEQERLEEQAQALENILQRVSCAGSAVFGVWMVDATPFRTVLERDLNKLATTSTRVMQPEANAAYIGIAVRGSPQEHNPFNVIFKRVQQPSTTRVVSDQMMRLLFLEAQELARRTTHADGSVEYEVLSDAFNFEPGKPGNVALGEPATQLSVHLASRPRMALDKEQKKLHKANPKDPRLPPVQYWYHEPASWDDGKMGMSFDEFVSLVHDPNTGMHAYVAAATQSNKLQPQENEYQRLEPALDQVLENWSSQERARATGLHLLWAPTDGRTSNYELFYLQRNLLSQKPLAVVQHIQAVLFNGGGTALQIVQPKAMYDRGEAPTARHLLAILQRPEFRMLWQKRISVAEKFGIGARKQFGPCFKVPKPFNKKYRDQSVAGVRPPFTHTDVAAIQYPILNDAGEKDEEQKDEELEKELSDANCATGDDTGIYVCEMADRVILTFVTREADIAAILSLDQAVYEFKMKEWNSLRGAKPIPKTVTMQSVGLSRGSSVKTIEHGHPVTDIIRNKPFEPNAAKMMGQMTLDEEAQAMGRICEKRYAVPPEVLRECGASGMFSGRDYNDPVRGPFLWASDNRKYAWVNENYERVLLTAMEGNQQLMNQLEAHSIEYNSAEEAAAAAIADRPNETAALHAMMRSPIGIKKVTHKMVDPGAGLTASGRQRCVRIPDKEPVYLPLGGAPRLSDKMRQAIQCRRPAAPAALPVRSNLEQEQEQAAGRLRQMPTQPGENIVTALTRHNAESLQRKQQAEAQMREYEKQQKEEEKRTRESTLARNAFSRASMANRAANDIEAKLPGWCAIKANYNRLLHGHNATANRKIPKKQIDDKCSRLQYCAGAVVTAVKAGKLTTKTGEEMLQLDEQQLSEALAAHFASTSSKKQMIREGITNFKNYKNLVAAVRDPCAAGAVIMDEDD